MEKGLLKTLAYRVLASEGVVSRNVAKRGSEQWGRDASQFHQKWQRGARERRSASSGCGPKLKRVEHHLSHAANAYYTSGFDEALIVTLDGYGSGLAGSISVGRDGKIERLHGLEYPHSLGTFYESVTSALGFKPSRHEGKIVGLAAYGDPGSPRRRAAAPLRSGATAASASSRRNNVYFARLLATQFPKIDVAAAYQHVLEDVADRVRRAVPQEDRPAESRAVGRRRRQRQAESAPARDRRASTSIFIHPNMGDGGCGTGAALLEFAGNAGSLRQPLNDVYLGPEFSTSEIADALNRAQLPFTEYTPIEPKIAHAARGRQGRRALRRPHGVRPARARQPVDPVSRQGAGREPVAEPAARPDGVHAVRAGDALRAPRTRATRTSTAPSTPRSS